MFRHHLVALRKKKLSSRITLLWQFLGLKQAAGAHTARNFPISGL